jgi:hypothetical protein
MQFFKERQKEPCTSILEHYMAEGFQFCASAAKATWSIPEYYKLMEAAAEPKEN